MDLVFVHPGEHFVTNENIIIGTVLGSCIAVALWDEKLKIGGLNHYMLASEYGYKNAQIKPIGRGRGCYAQYAMEVLVNDLIKLGSNRKDLKAKVFGGGEVLKRRHGSSVSGVAEQNVKYAFDYLNMEGIPILTHDVGGTCARKIYFFPSTSKVLLKRVENEVDVIASVINEESEYLLGNSSAGEEEDTIGDIVWFND